MARRKLISSFTMWDCRICYFFSLLRRIGCKWAHNNRQCLHRSGHTRYTIHNQYDFIMYFTSFMRETCVIYANKENKQTNPLLAHCWASSILCSPKIFLFNVRRLPMRFPTVYTHISSCNNWTKLGAISQTNPFRTSEIVRAVCVRVCVLSVAARSVKPHNNV